LKIFKIYCLVIILLSSIITIIISLFIPNLQNRPKFQLPNQLSLRGWKLQSSKDFDKALKNGAIAAKKYIYISPRQDLLEIDSLYISGTTAITRYLEISGFNSSQNLNIHYLDSIGYYALFRDGDRAYLSSCINPHGITTITEEQFFHNINLKHIGFYLLGFRDLRDSKCLLMTLSVSLKTTKLDKAYETLKNSWVYLYQNWKTNFL
jgi:cyanosortase A-associated protein